MHLAQPPETDGQSVDLEKELQREYTAFLSTAEMLESSHVSQENLYLICSIARQAFNIILNLDTSTEGAVSIAIAKIVRLREKILSLLEETPEDTHRKYEFYDPQAIFGKKDGTKQVRVGDAELDSMVA